MSPQTRRAAALTILALALTGCSGSGDDEAESASPSESSSSASSPSTAEPGETTAPAEEPSSAAPGAEAAPVTAPPTVAAGADPTDTNQDGMSQEASAFFESGGACFSDFFPAGVPSQDVLTEVQEYCATTDVSAWDLEDGAPNPFGIPDPEPDIPETTDADGTAENDGYQRPSPDENGYVGPSQDYYSYDGYVEPGFEYQVGSECFDADLGRCKTSGELQTEYMEGREVEDLMREQGRDLPGSSGRTSEEWAEMGFGCFKDEAGNDFCVDPPPGI